MRLLSKEKRTIEKKQELELKTHNNIEQIRNSLLQDKKILHQAKKERHQSLIEKKREINQLKDKINGTLKTWRNNLFNQNQNEALKVKCEKNKIEEMIQLNKYEQICKNKNIHDKIHYSEVLKEEKKKKEEVSNNNISQ